MEEQEIKLTRFDFYFKRLFFAVFVIFVLCCIYLVWKEYSFVATCAECVNQGMIPIQSLPINLTVV